jgi:AhpC/TSA antioxidant enzyme
LYRKREEFKTLRADIVLISFAGAEQGRRWRDETQVDLPLLFDPERQVYRAYELDSSFWRAWQPKVWRRYAQMLRAGWKWRGIQGDSGQLGGDFIVDARGILRFAHRSQDPTDRPSIPALLNQLLQSPSAI